MYLDFIFVDIVSQRVTQTVYILSDIVVAALEIPKLWGKPKESWVDHASSMLLLAHVSRDWYNALTGSCWPLDFQPGSYLKTATWTLFIINFNNILIEKRNAQFRQFIRIVHRSLMFEEKWSAIFFFFYSSVLHIFFSKNRSLIIRLSETGWINIRKLFLIAWFTRRPWRWRVCSAIFPTWSTAILRLPLLNGAATGWANDGIYYLSHTFFFGSCCMPVTSRCSDC